MKRREEKRPASLVIRVRFEVSHVAAACLVDAYERVVPRHRRTRRVNDPVSLQRAAPPAEPRSGRSQVC